MLKARPGASNAGRFGQHASAPGVNAKRRAISQQRWARRQLAREEVGGAAGEDPTKEGGDGAATDAAAPRRAGRLQAPRPCRAARAAAQNKRGERRRKRAKRTGERRRDQPRATGERAAKEPGAQQIAGRRGSTQKKRKKKQTTTQKMRTAGAAPRGTRARPARVRWSGPDLGGCAVTAANGGGSAQRGPGNGGEN